MSDQYIISVGAKADFSQLKSETKDGAQSIEDFQTRSAKAVQEFQAAAADGAAAAEFLNKQMKELGAAGIAVVPAMEQATAALRASQSAEEADALAAKAAAAAKRELSSQTAIAGQELRVLEGSTMGMARAAGAFATQALGLGPIMAAAFPVIGAVAMLDMLFQLGKGVAKFASDAQDLSSELGVGWLTGAIGQIDGLKEEVKQADDEMMNLAKDMDALRSKGQELDIQHIRLTQGPKAGYEAQIKQQQDYINAQRQMMDNIQKSSAPDRQQVSYYEAHESITHAGEVAYLEAKKRVEAYDKQIQDLQGHVDNAQKEIRNFNDEIANIKPPKTPHEAGPNYSDIAAEQRLHGASLGELVLYWQNVVATTGKYHEQLLRAEEEFQKQLSEKGKIKSPAALGPEPGPLDMAGFAAAMTPAMKPDLRFMNLSSLQGLQKQIAPLGPVGLDEQQLTEYQRIQDRITELQQEAARKREEAAKQEAEKQQQAYTRALDSVTGPLNRFTDYWLTSNRNLGLAFARMCDQMALELTNSLLKMAEKWVAHELLVTAAHMAGIATRKGADAVADSQLYAQLAARLVRWIATELGMTSAHVTANATKAAADMTAAATTAATTSAANVAATTSYTAVAAMGAAASQAFIPVVGPELAAAAAAAMTGMGAGYTALAAFETGTDYIPRPGIAMLHKGEAVATAGENSRISQVIKMASANGGGQGGVHFHDHSNFTGIDGASVASMARSNGQTWRRETMRQLRLMNKV